jgi:hypothetical protein
MTRLRGRGTLAVAFSRRLFAMTFDAEAIITAVHPVAAIRLRIRTKL